MTPASTAHDLRPLHPERPIHVPDHRAGDGVEEGRPATAGFELVGGFVEGRRAANAGVDATGGHVPVVGAGVRCFGTLFAENAELFWRRDISVGS